MPAPPSHPGIYVEEVPGALRTITGVPTSITAFVGRARRGVTGLPVVLHSLADYERAFGGLWAEDAMGFAVRDFFLNGGTRAIAVRLFRARAGERTTAALNANGLALAAASPGAWGNLLQVRISHPAGPGEAPDGLFDLSVRDGGTGGVEIFRGVSVAAGHPRRVDAVLEGESRLLRMAGPLPDAQPAAHDDPDPGMDVWTSPPPAGRLFHSAVAVAGMAGDGDELTAGEFIGPGLREAGEGLYALDRVDLFNLLSIPPFGADDAAHLEVIGAAVAYCEARRAMMLVDRPWTGPDAAMAGLGALPRSGNAAVYFPLLRQPDPLHGGRTMERAPSGAVAGIFARTDAAFGVWKAPAGAAAALAGVPALSVALTGAETGLLNPLGINCLRSLPGTGPVVWGARTLLGDDVMASDWKYVPVRRLALFLEESLARGTRWAVFEQNGEPLWSSLRLAVGAFLQNLFVQGAFQGQTPQQAYLVKCDAETTTRDDLDAGQVNILVGFAPIKPAEFVLIRISQRAAPPA